MNRNTICTGLNMAAVVAALAPSLASAHTRPRPTPENIWQAWYVDPLIAIPMLLASWLYLRGVANLWATVGRAKVINRIQRGAWLWAMLSLGVALFSPINALGGALFSAHMVQHLVLMVITPGLLAYARPSIGIWWGLPAAWRSAIANKVRGRRSLSMAHALFQSPASVLVIFTVALWLWHVPALYAAALRSNVLHALEHVSFLAGAYVLWSWMLSVQFGFGRRGANRHGVAILIIFAVVMQSGVLGAILTFARGPLYAVHEAYTQVWGFTLLEDQQLAGLLMWIPMGMTFTLVALFIFRAWMIASERQARMQQSGLQSKTEART